MGTHTVAWSFGHDLVWTLQSMCIRNKRKVSGMDPGPSLTGELRVVYSSVCEHPWTDHWISSIHHRKLPWGHCSTHKVSGLYLCLGLLPWYVWNDSNCLGLNILGTGNNHCGLYVFLSTGSGLGSDRQLPALALPSQPPPAAPLGSAPCRVLET